MKRQLIGIILALALALSLPGGALAAEIDVRQTDSRDYTPGEIRSFYAAVKEYIVPLRIELYRLLDAYYRVDEYKALLVSEYVKYAGGDGARLDPRGQTTRVGAAAILLRAKWL